MLTPIEIGGILLTFLTLRILLPVTIVFAVSSVIKNFNRQFQRTG